MGGVEDDRRLVIKDYFSDDPNWRLDQAMGALSSLSTDSLLDLKEVVGVLHLSNDSAELESSLQPRGYRLLGRIPRLPEPVIERIVARYSSLQKILRAGAEDLEDIEGVGRVRARAIKEGLSRLAETSILERYN